MLLSSLPPVLTPIQKATFKKVQAFILANPKPTAAASLTLDQRFSAKDRRILQSLADDLHLELAWDQVNEKDDSIVVATFQADVVDGVSSDESSSDEKKEGGNGEAEAGEGDEATMRVLKKWAKAKVVEEDEEDAEEAYDKKVEEAMEEWKKGYYKVRLILSPRVQVFSVQRRFPLSCFDRFLPPYRTSHLTVVSFVR